MIFSVVAYKDTKLNVFSQPVFITADLNRDDLIETFRRMCASPETPSSYFELDVYLLGTFDDKTAIFNVASPEYLCSLGDFKHLKAETTEVVANG